MSSTTTDLTADTLITRQRLIDFLTMPEGWGENGDEKQISHLAAARAQRILNEVDGDSTLFGVFPTEGGGIGLETWVKAEPEDRLRSVTVEIPWGDDDAMESYAVTLNPVNPQSSTAVYEEQESTDLQVIINAVKTWLGSTPERAYFPFRS